MPNVAETKIVPVALPDSIFHNGVILTMDENQPQAQAIAIAGERILAVGTNDEILALKNSSTQVTSRLEENLPQIGYEHRHIARVWPAWLKFAWSQVEIWTGWSEVRIPGLSVIPDGLAWGRIQGYETLFWLEVGDGHKKQGGDHRYYDQEIG